MRALVVYAHPEPDSFVSHLLAQVVAGLHEAGHEHRTLDLHAQSFDPVLSADEWRLHRADASEKPWTFEYTENLRWADTIVWVYPTWWSGPPAILKGWIDRVWTNGVAYLHDETGLHPGPLKHIREMVVVTTHGSSRWVNLIEGEVGRKLFRRTLRLLCGWRCRTRWLAMYGVDRSTEEDRRAFAAEVKEAFLTL